MSSAEPLLPSSSYSCFMKQKKDSPAHTRSGFAAVATPGVMISNAWPQSRLEEGATLAATRRVLERHPFFEAFQTVDIPYSGERRAFRKLIGDQGHSHTYTLTRIFAEQNLNPSSLDADIRRKTWEAVIRQMDDAAEAGAQSVTVVSGSRPDDPSERMGALAGLEETMTKICEAAARRGDLFVVIEPLDYEAHKRATLGSTEEALELCRRLAGADLRLKLCIDTAHLILNREDVVGAVEKARPQMVDFHFCNAVTDRAHSLFGDRHLPFGEPGVVDVNRIAELMNAFARSGFLSEVNRPRVFCEVMTPEDWEPMRVVAHCEESLEGAWAMAREVFK